MLKGISLQLNGISNYLEGQLRAGDLSWESYLLNTEKNSGEMLKLARIVLTELDDYLPRGLGAAFDRAIALLKQYFQTRPRGEVEEEQEVRGEYDDLQRFLENKPEITTNDEERGELFRFLAMNEQKERNTQMMLESMPRYSCDYAYHPLQAHRARLPDSRPTLASALPEIAKGGKGGNGQCKAQGKMSHSEKRQSLEVREGEAQTDLSLEVVKDIFSSYAVTSVAQGNRQFCDIATEMGDFLQEMAAQQRQAGERASGEENTGKEGSPVREKKAKRQRDEPKDYIEADITAQQKAIESRAEKQSAETSTKKIVPKQEAKAGSKGKKAVEKRESSNSLSSSRKDLLKGVSKKTARGSKDWKEEGSRPAKESKFSKEGKSHSPSNYIATILEIPQELANSTSYEVTPEQLQKRNADIHHYAVVIDHPVGVTVPKQDELEQRTNEEAKMSDEEPKKEEEEQHAQTMKKHSKKSTWEKEGKGEREKLASSKEEPSHAEFVIEQAYACTSTHPFFRKPSRDNQAESSLPKIEQRSKGRQERAESLKKKIYESSPYFKPERLLKGSNSQFIHRSLHLNAPDLLSPSNACNPACNPLSPPSRFQHTQVEWRREGALREGEERVVREVEALAARRTGAQWSQVLRSIRHYELMHASLCGENCVHLSKFYEFLKRRNLGQCLRRRELLLHKKNIEIGTAL